MDTSTALEASPSSSPSSSSSSSSTTSSSSPYDVFMSFSEDTRKTFTDHLYWTMKDAGIDFFMEENESIRIGENISDKVKQIIEGSKVSVIVFSSRYADSIWCLEELVQIMECRRTLKQMVLPIFYDLSPSDVIGTFELAFQKHRERFHEDTDIQEKLRRWTGALTAAAGLTVRVFRTTNGYEGMFIREIIDKITKLLQSPTPIEIAFTDSAKSPISTLPGKLPGTGSTSGSSEYHCSNSKRRNGPGQYPESVAADGVPVPCKKSLVRHPSLMKTKTKEMKVEPGVQAEDFESDFIPIVRSGAWADIGCRLCMEDVYVCVDNFIDDYGLKDHTDGPSAFYGVFDGHGGKHAADFASSHLPKFILENEDFPTDIERVVTSAFLHTDTAFKEACTLDAKLASGTTALIALLIGRLLVVANAGDCRAVLCRRGKAIEMSRDHKPICSKEKQRIEASGGHVDDGYLNGQLSVARALGDWHMEGMKAREGGPLSAEPELMTAKLTEEDEFLIIGCDGIWDVFRSQNAVDFARRRLQEHNDPAACSKDLVDEALKRKSADNLTAVVVCFQPQPPPNLIAPLSISTSPKNLAFFPMQRTDSLPGFQTLSVNSELPEALCNYPTVKFEAWKGQ